MTARHGERTYYVYDASGQRVRKVTERANAGRQTPTRMRDASTSAASRSTASTTATAPTATLERETLHVMDDKQRIALVETRTLDTAGNDPAPAQLIRYQFGNHLGSASLELDEQAQIISYEEYSPYGSTTYQAVRSQTETAKRYRYTGKERDEESGLYYHGARYYAPWLGRWVSCDPVDIGGESNRYAYVRGSPTRFRDSTGMFEEPGHYYTVYAMGLAAGFTPEVARRVAIFSQAEDEIVELDAAQRGLVMGKTEAGRIAAEARDAGESPKQRNERERAWEEGTFVQAGGHAFTGGPAAVERSNRAEWVLEYQPGTVEHGFAAHAYGDSFSHTVIDWNQPNVEAQDAYQYTVPFGHGPAGQRTVDFIETRPELYKRYAGQLYDIFERQAPKVTLHEDRKAVEKLIASVAATKDQSEQLKLLKDFIAKHGGSLDYAPEEHVVERADGASRRSSGCGLARCGSNQRGNQPTRISRDRRAEEHRPLRHLGGRTSAEAEGRLDLQAIVVTQSRSRRMDWGQVLLCYVNIYRKTGGEDLGVRRQLRTL